MSMVEFDGLPLATKQGVVMTPRACSVALVEVAVAYLANRRCRVADVGTGSGAIVIHFRATAA